MALLCIFVFANAIYVICRLRPTRETTLGLLNCICAPWFVRWVTEMASSGYLSSCKKLCRFFPANLVSTLSPCGMLPFSPRFFLKGQSVLVD